MEELRPWIDIPRRAAAWEIGNAAMIESSRSTSTTTMRPKRFDQQQALQAAMLQFWECGYAASSMQNLVDRMGISRQSLYDTYGNKRELFIQALRCYRRSIVEPRVQRLVDPERDPVEALREHFQAIIDGWSQQIAGCLMVRTTTEISPSDQEIGSLVDDSMRQLREALQSVVERGQASGAIDGARTAADITARIMILSAGLQVLCRLPAQASAQRPSPDSLIAGLGVRTAAC